MNNLLDEMERDLSNAKTIAMKDPSDLRHSNPGKVRRQERERHEAGQNASKLERAMRLATELDELGINWIRRGNWIHFLVDNGNAYHPVYGETVDDQDASEIIDRQIEAIQYSAPGEQLRALVLSTLNLKASRDLLWIRDRMDGVSTPKFRKGFLVEAGLLVENGDWLELSQLARDYELLTEHEGEYGPWFTATALGTAFIYKCHLAGNVPMTKACKHGPMEQYELDAITKDQEKALAQLPAELLDRCNL